MKNSTTSVALTTATAIATRTFRLPRSTKATATVMNVSTIRAPKIAEVHALRDDVFFVFLVLGEFV